MKNMLPIAGLLATGQQKFVIPNNDIRVQFAMRIPWEDPTGMLMIRRVEFEPHDSVINLRFKGSFTPRAIVVLSVPVSVEVGFTITAVARIRYNRDESALYCEADSITIDSLTPLDGLGPLGDLVGAIVPKAFGVAHTTVHAVSSRMPNMPQVLERSRGFVGKLMPGFAKRAGAKVADVAGRATKQIGDTSADLSVAASTKIKGLIIGGVNAFLAKTPVYHVPEEIQGVPLGRAVEDIRIEGSNIVVHLNTVNNSRLQNIRYGALAVAGVIIAGVLMWIF